MKFVIIIKIILTACLLLCLTDMPEDYYPFVRYVALAGFAVLAYTSYKSGRQTEMFIFGALALLFQPFYIFPLDSLQWVVLNVMVALGLLLSIWVDRKKK